MNKKSQNVKIVALLPAQKQSDAELLERLVRYLPRSNHCSAAFHSCRRFARTRDRELREPSRIHRTPRFALCGERTAGEGKNESVTFAAARCLFERLDFFAQFGNLTPQTFERSKFLRLPKNHQAIRTDLALAHRTRDRLTHSRVRPLARFCFSAAISRFRAEFSSRNAATAAVSSRCARPAKNSDSFSALAASSGISVG